MKKDPKQILPYLPYNVKYAYRSPFDEKFNYEKILSLDDPEAIQLLLIHSDFSLVLRPLSDLTKEIEIDGEKLIPVDEIENLFGPFVLNHNPKILHFTLESWTTWIDLHNLTNKLLEWHFDISNLIEKGHAIDINTL